MSGGARCRPCLRLPPPAPAPGPPPPVTRSRPSAPEPDPSRSLRTARERAAEEAGRAEEAAGAA